MHRAAADHAVAGDDARAPDDPSAHTPPCAGAPHTAPLGRMRRRARLSAKARHSLLETVAERAAWALARTRPGDSAAYGLTRGQKLVFAAVTLTAAAAFIANPGLAWAAMRAGGAAAFAFLIAFRVAACLTPAASAPARRWSGPLPVYTVIAPLYDEANVVEDLVCALDRLDYPSDLLDVKLVVESDDHATLAAARDAARKSGFAVVCAPPGEPRTKPRALNIALERACGDFVVVFDAEDRPAPSQLRAALDAFASGGETLACVQAPLSWYNARENWLTRQFALEYAAQFHVVLPALARWGWPLPLGGTSNHFRTDVLRSVGAWDPHNVTEDADLGFRLAEESYRAGVIGPGTREEATVTLTAWRRQRSRWIKGFIQTWCVRMRRPARLYKNAGLSGLVCLQATIGLTILSSLLHGPLALSLIYSLGAILLAPDAPHLGGVNLAFLGLGYATAATVACIGARRGGERGLLRAILSMPLYWPLQTIAAASAIIDLIHRPFHWQKTHHGVSKITAGPPTDPNRGRSRQHESSRSSSMR